MKYKFIIITILCLILAPRLVGAAVISASTDSSVSAMDTAIVNVFINTEGQNINSVDGSISLSDEHGGNFEVRDISLVDSVFTMWPRKPSLEAGQKIYFVGGVPGGVKGDKLLLFRIIVKINASGNFSVSPNKLVAYLNDGSGTGVNISGSNSLIVVGKAKSEPQDKWKEIVSNDNVAPEPFTINVVQDKNLFDGRKFLSFETFDSGSGVSYYEVQEGKNPPVKTGNTYMLIDQAGKVDIVVTAYDKAGNFQIATLKVNKGINWLAIAFYVVILSILYMAILRIIKIKKRKNVI